MYGVSALAGKPPCARKASRAVSMDWSPDGSKYCVGTEEGEIWSVALPALTDPLRTPQKPTCVIHTHTSTVNCWYAFGSSRSHRIASEALEPLRATCYRVNGVVYR